MRIARGWSWIGAAAGLAVGANGAAGLLVIDSVEYVELYEMDVSPELVGGTLYGNVMEHADGSGTYGPSGFVFADGIATFLDDGNSSGNQGLRLNNAAGALGTNGYVADMRIKWLAGCEGNGAQKSMGFAGNNGDGRGIRIDNGWIHYVSSGVVTSAAVDMREWVDLRVVVEPDGSQAVYLWQGEWPIGNWTKLIEVIAPGATGVNTAITQGPGFFLGSWGGGSTTLCSFQIDYLRVGRVVPEPATLVLLVCGAGLLLRRRRS
jgi:hypothetical protein